MSFTSTADPSSISLWSGVGMVSFPDQWPIWYQLISSFNTVTTSQRSRSMKMSLSKVKGLPIVSNTLRTCCVGDSWLRFPRNCISEQEAPKLSARHLQFPGLDSMSSSFINVLRTDSGIFFSLRVRCRGQTPYLKGWQPFSFEIE